MSALKQAGGSNSIPPPDSGSNSGDTSPSYTKEQLTSMASEIGASDSKRSTLMSKLAANFDKADSNGDGKINGQEAMNYDQSTGSSNSRASAYQGGGGLESDIKSLIQQLTSSNSSSSTNSSSSLSDLKASFEKLVSAIGGANSSTLEGFLNTLAEKLQGSPNAGNIVNTTA